MDIQKALLSKLIHDGDIVTAVNSKITPEFFTDDRYRRIYEYLIEHWRRYGTTVDLEIMESVFPSYDWPVYAHTTEFFIDGLRQRRKKAIVTDTLTEVMKYLHDPDPDSTDISIDILRDGLVQVALETTPTLDIDFTKQFEAIMERLDQRSDNPGFLRGISTGFRGIDYVTGGLQAEQFVVLIGLPKAFKSATLLYMAKYIHGQAKVPLFIGFEMSNEEQTDRLTSLYGKVSLTDVMNGTFDVNQRDDIRRELKLVSQSRAFITSVDLASATTVSGVQAKIMEYQPDVVFIDGAYLMQTELPRVEPGSAAALTDIARSLKKLAQSQSIPIVVTTQATMTRSKGGLNMFSAMYTQAWGQSADVLLGVERVDPAANDLDAVVIKLSVLASRAGPRGETQLHWDWSKGSCTEITSDEFRRAASNRGDDDD